MPNSCIDYKRTKGKRLYSHILHDACLGYGLEFFKQQVTSENSNYDNTMHKYLLDFEMDNYPFNIKEKNLNENINDIELIDVADDMTKDSVKTAILSSSRLPNILQMSRLNEAGSRHANRIGNKTVKAIFEGCISRGLLKKTSRLITMNYKKRRKKTMIFLNYIQIQLNYIQRHLLVRTGIKNVVAYEHEMEMVDTKEC